MTLKNPCLECDLLNEDKNNPTCRDCVERIEYITTFGDAISSLPEDINMNGDVGTADSQEDIEELEDMIASRKELAIKKEEIDTLVEDVCEDYGIDIKHLKTGGKKGRSKVSEARHEIIKQLNRFSLSQTEIGEIVGVSGVSVCSVLKKQEKIFPKKIKHKERIPSLPKKNILIDFTDREEIYNQLMQRAADQLRTPENQVLYMIKKEFDASLE